MPGCTCQACSDRHITYHAQIMQHSQWLSPLPYRIFLEREHMHAARSCSEPCILVLHALMFCTCMLRIAHESFNDVPYDFHGFCCLAVARLSPLPQTHAGIEPVCMFSCSRVHKYLRKYLESPPASGRYQLLIATLVSFMFMARKCVTHHAVACNMVNTRDVS